jgi:hypothetical protein
MDGVTQVFVIVAKVFIYLGGAMFTLCFAMGAYAFYQIFATTLYTIRITKMWNEYNKLSPEAKIEALKSGKFKQ